RIHLHPLAGDFDHLADDLIVRVRIRGCCHLPFLLSDHRMSCAMRSPSWIAVSSDRWNIRRHIWTWRVGATSAIVAMPNWAGNLKEDDPREGGDQASLVRLPAAGSRIRPSRPMSCQWSALSQRRRPVLVD